MQVNPQFLLPRAPLFNRDGLTADEARIATSLQRNLSDIGRSYDEYHGALALFEYARGGETQADAAQREKDATGTFAPITKSFWRDWVWIAVRFGGLSLRNYGQAMSVASRLFGRIPAWAGKVDGQGTKKATNEFNAQFPGIDKVRHSIAHPEFYSNPDKDTAAAGTIPGFANFGGGASMQSSLNGRTFVATFEGQFVQYDLSVENLILLRDLTVRYYDCFQALDAFAGFPRG